MENRNKGRFEGSNIYDGHIIKEIMDYVRCLLITSVVIHKRDVSDDKWPKEFAWCASPLTKVFFL